MLPACGHRSNYLPGSLLLDGTPVKTFSFSVRYRYDLRTSAGSSFGWNDPVPTGAGSEPSRPTARR
jgi:hypothetical protein